MPLSRLGHQPPIVATTGRPTALGVPILDLQRQKCLSHLLVPFLPRLATEVAHDLSTIIPVVEVDRISPGQMGQQVIDSVDQSVVSAFPAKKLSTQQTFCRHRQTRTTPRRVGVL